VGFPLIPVVEYLNYLNTTGKRSNTVKTKPLCFKAIFYVFTGEKERLQGDSFKKT
jgi:hypothetical protein